MTELIIKPAAEKDIPVIHEMASEIWHAYYPEIISVEQISYMLEKMYSESSLIKQMKEGHRFYIAHREGQPIGYFSYSKSESNNFFLHIIGKFIHNSKKSINGFRFCVSGRTVALSLFLSLYYCVCVGIFLCPTNFTFINVWHIF